MKFSGAVGCIPERSDYFGTNCINYLQGSQHVKNGGLEEVWTLLGAFDVLPLAASGLPAPRSLTNPLSKSWIRR